MNYIKIISGASKSLNFYVMFIVCTSLTNVAAGRGLEARYLVLAGGQQDSMPTVKTSTLRSSLFVTVKQDLMTARWDRSKVVSHLVIRDEEVLHDD
jgi:hypothetical protein